MKKRIVSLVLLASMLLSCVSGVAYAEMITKDDIDKVQASLVESAEEQGETILAGAVADNSAVVADEVLASLNTALANGTLEKVEDTLVDAYGIIDNASLEARANAAAAKDAMEAARNDKETAAEEAASAGANANAAAEALKKVENTTSLNEAKQNDEAAKAAADRAEADAEEAVSAAANAALQAETAKEAADAAKEAAVEAQAAYNKTVLEVNALLAAGTLEADAARKLTEEALAKANAAADAAAQAKKEAEAAAQTAAAEAQTAHDELKTAVEELEAAVAANAVIIGEKTAVAAATGAALAAVKTASAAADAVVDLYAFEAGALDVQIDSLGNAIEDAERRIAELEQEIADIEEHDLRYLALKGDVEALTESVSVLQETYKDAIAARELKEQAKQDAFDQKLAEAKDAIQGDEPDPQKVDALVALVLMNLDRYAGIGEKNVAGVTPVGDGMYKILGEDNTESIIMAVLVKDETTSENLIQFKNVSAVQNAMNPEDFKEAGEVENPEAFKAHIKTAVELPLNGENKLTIKTDENGNSAYLYESGVLQAVNKAIAEYEESLQWFNYFEKGIAEAARFIINLLPDYQSTVLKVDGQLYLMPYGISVDNAKSLLRIPGMANALKVSVYDDSNPSYTYNAGPDNVANSNSFSEVWKKADDEGVMLFAEENRKLIEAQENLEKVEKELVGGLNNQIANLIAQNATREDRIETLEERLRTVDMELNGGLADRLLTSMLTGKPFEQSETAKELEGQMNLAFTAPTAEERREALRKAGELTGRLLQENAELSDAQETVRSMMAVLQAVMDPTFHLDDVKAIASLIQSQNVSLKTKQAIADVIERFVEGIHENAVDDLKKAVEEAEKTVAEKTGILNAAAVNVAEKDAAAVDTALKAARADLENAIACKLAEEAAEANKAAQEAYQAYKKLLLTPGKVDNTQVCKAWQAYHSARTAAVIAARDARIAACNADAAVKSAEAARSASDETHRLYVTMKNEEERRETLAASGVPQTGDAPTMIIYAAMLLTSLSGTGFVLKKKEAFA